MDRIPIYKHFIEFSVRKSFLTYRSLEHINALLKIHSKVHHGPVNAFLHVLLLLQHKHVMIEKLLKFLEKNILNC